MFQSVLLLSHLFSFSAEAGNHHIYDLLIKQPGNAPYKSNLYFNDPMTVKEIKIIVQRNERITTPLAAIKMFREGSSHEMNDDELLGVNDPGSRSLVITAS